MNHDELLELAEMFDTIVNSTNPAVQRSLQYTAVLAKLSEETDNFKQAPAGPFAKMFGALKHLEEEIRLLKRSVQILENNSGSYTNKWDTSVVDLNMNSGIAALTTAQITALTGMSTVTLQPISPEDITFDLSAFDMKP